MDAKYHYDQFKEVLEEAREKAHLLSAKEEYDRLLQLADMHLQMYQTLAGNYTRQTYEPWRVTCSHDQLYK